MILGSVSLEELRKKFTEEEIVILLNTRKEFRYISRDFNGLLYIYNDTPCKSCDDKHWEAGYAEIMFAHKHLFRNIKWEDEEPYKFR